VADKKSAASQKAILELVGNPKRLDRELSAFRRSARAFSSQHPSLIEKFPKQWVAVHRGKVRAKATTYNALMRQVEKNKLPREHIMVRYIDKNARTMIL
jgi:hypothetical protein